MGKDSFTKCYRRYLPAMIISALFLLIMVSVASGMPHRLAIIPDKGAKFMCGTCHYNPGGGGPVNPFGADYGKIGIKAEEKYTADLGKLDSDGDGSTNDQEFKAGTNPGDADSKP
ncbi:MAG: hypothetical protein JRJ65_14555 [Deltaproteobacteria bacterium]|nr:hypothetical protein [Deltaproteobacteria bacterium]